MPFPWHPHFPGTAGVFGTMLSGPGGFPAPWYLEVPLREGATAQGSEPMVSFTWAPCLTLQKELCCKGGLGRHKNPDVQRCDRHLDVKIARTSIYRFLLRQGTASPCYLWCSQPQRGERGCTLRLKLSSAVIAAPMDPNLRWILCLDTNHGQESSCRQTPQLLKAGAVL